jgi:hypothetical protein
MTASPGGTAESMCSTKALRVWSSLTFHQVRRSISCPVQHLQQLQRIFPLAGGEQSIQSSRSTVRWLNSSAITSTLRLAYGYLRVTLRLADSEVPILPTCLRVYGFSGVQGGPVYPLPAPRRRLRRSRLTHHASLNLPSLSLGAPVLPDGSPDPADGSLTALLTRNHSVKCGS